MPITEVNVEVEVKGTGYPGYPENGEIIGIKTRPDNTIIIHPAKTYTKAEVEKLIIAGYARGAFDEKSGNSFYVSDEWIEENL